MSATARLKITLGGLAAQVLCIAVGLVTETTNPFRLAISIAAVTVGWAIVTLAVIWQERKATR